MSGRTQGERKLSRPAANATAKETSVVPYPQNATADTTVVQRASEPHSAVDVTFIVHDLAGEEPLLAALVPGFVRLERHAQHSRQHRRRQVLGVLAGDGLVLPVAVMLGDVAVMRRIRRHCDADRGRHETTWLVGRRFGDHREDDLSRLQHAHPFFPIHKLAMRRKDRADAHEIEIREMRVAQRHLEAGELFLVPANTLGQEGLGRDEHA
jgi:hypothetical protein